MKRRRGGACVFLEYAIYGNSKPLWRRILRECSNLTEFFVRLSCVYFRSCNLRFLRTYSQSGTMAGIRQGSYIILSAVLEIMILVDKLFDKPFLKVLLAIMIFSTVFQVKPGQIHHGFIWPGSIWKTDWEPTPLPNGTLFLTKKQYFSQGKPRVCANLLG